VHSPCSPAGKPVVEKRSPCHDRALPAELTIPKMNADQRQQRRVEGALMAQAPLELDEGFDARSSGMIRQPSAEMLSPIS